MSRLLACAIFSLCVATLSVGAYWMLETYPFSGYDWRGSRIQYLNALDSTVAIWDAPGHGAPSHVLVIVQKGDTTNGRQGLGSMRRELERVNEAAMAVFVSCDIDARSAGVSSSGEGVVIRDNNLQLVVDKNLRSFRCERDAAPGKPAR